MLIFAVGVVIGAVVGGIIGAVDYSKRKERHERECREQQAVAVAKGHEINQLRQTKTTLQNQVSESSSVVNQYHATAKNLKQRSEQYRSDTEALREERDVLEKQKNDIAMSESFNQMKF